jgi:predicted  nucleic acid-binding Zn-ribbon protein
LQKAVYALIELQEVDNRLDELKEERGDLPLIVEELDSKFSRKNSDLKDKQDDLKKFKLRQRELELIIDESKEKLAKFEEQLYQVKTNKEYDAITLQTDSAKTQLEESENESIVLDDDITELNKEISDLEQEISEVESELEENRLELNKKLQATADEENLLHQERKIVLEKASTELIKTYELVREARNGQGIAKVFGNVCGGCHAFIPPQKIAEVRKMKQIFTCEACGRILVWHDIEE